VSRPVATESSPVSQEVVRLYEQLRGRIHANDQAGVDDASRELMRAGRLLSEIIQYGTSISDEVAGSGLAPPQLPTQYYWGQQWNVQSNLPDRLPKRAQQAANHTARAGAPSQELPRAPASASKVSVHSRQDWVEEWQARQGGRENAVVLTETADDFSVPEVQNGAKQRRLSAMFYPIFGLYGGAVVLVCIGLFLIMELGQSKFSSIQESSRGQFVGSVDSAIIEDQSAQTNRPAEIKPTSADSSSPVASSPAVAVVQPRLEPASPPAGAAEPESPTEKPNVDWNVESPTGPETAPPSGFDSARSSDATAIAQSPAVGAPGPRVEIVLKGASASAVVEPRSRSARPAASVVSPELTARLQTAPVPAGLPPNAGETPPGPGAETALNRGEAEPGRVEQAAPTVTALGASEVVQAKPAPEKTAPDALSATIDTAGLLSRGDALFGAGDITSARLFYERAADGGNAQAAIRLGETFDPTFLARAQAKGVRGEPAIALKWYKRGRELGASEADILITSLEGK
jgi:hypothetical protein